MALKLLNEYLNYADKVLIAILANAVGQERAKVLKGSMSILIWKVLVVTLGVG